MELIENNFGKVRCHECDSVVKVEKKGDLVYEIHDDCYSLTCPVCGAKRWLEKDNTVVQMFVYKKLTHR